MDSDKWQYEKLIHGEWMENHGYYIAILFNTQCARVYL
jgi:hypothetical protein